MPSNERSTFAPMVFAAGHWDEAPRAAPAHPVDVRIVTWNTWFGKHRFEQRCDALLADLERRRPDVIALQEVTQELLAELLAAPWIRAGYQISERHVFGYSVALLSRLPIRRLATLELPTEMGRRLLVAQLACGLTIATVHLESTREEARARARQLQLIQPALARHADVVLVGDMNFAPGAPLETAALDPALVDVWPVLHPEDPGYTVDAEINTMRAEFDNEAARKRIDRMFLRSARWRPRSIERIGVAPIDGDGTFTSDHFGLEATFITG